jgi:hypothetical protein
MGNFPNFTINKFRGMSKSRDMLNLLPGQLSHNQNYLYSSTGALYERGGGAELVVNPSTGSDPVFSLANYVAPNGTNYLITNQDATVYYYNSGWNDLSLTLTADKKIRWEGAGFEANRALYGANANDSIVKVAGNTPVGSLVSNSPTDAIKLKTHKNRLFAVNNADTLYFTEVLDFDTWNTGVNTIEIAPGIDGNIQGLEVWGDALFIFKEYGVYVLPNADDPVPDLNWVILRTDASTGTQSTDSVRRTRDGIYYLGSDNYIRSIGPAVSFSSNEYTLGNSGSPIVSFDIQDDLDQLADTTVRNNVQAITYGDLYIISMQSVNNSGSYNDLTYFADTSKFNQLNGIAKLQPYWGEFTGFDYDFFATQASGNVTKFYGAKGVTGNVQESLNDLIHNDDDSAIESRAILAWLPVESPGLFKRFKQLYFVGDTEGWNIDLKFNAYKLGTDLPGPGEGIEFEYTTSSSTGGTVGTAAVGTDVVGLTGVSSKKYRLNLRGHYFTAEFSNDQADQFNRVVSLTVFYRPIRNS